MGGFDADAGPSGLHFRVHGHGQKIFGFLGILGQLLPQEHGEALFQCGHHGMREGPHIHADHCVWLQTGVGVQVFGHQRAVGAGDNVGALGQGSQTSRFVHFAHAPGNVAVFAQSVLQQITHHGHVALVLQMGQMVIGQTEGLRAVKIVGVDGAEGRVHQLPGRQHRVARAPGLFAALGDGKALRQIVHFLIGVLDLHLAAGPVADDLPEQGLVFPLDDDNGLFKARPFRVEKGVIQNDLAVAAHGVDLLQPAVAAAHARGHNDQYRLFHALLRPFPSSRTISFISCQWASISCRSLSCVRARTRLCSG